MSEYVFGNPAIDLKEAITKVYESLKDYRASSSNSFILKVNKEPEFFIPEDEKLKCAKNLLHVIELVETRDEIFPQKDIYARYFPEMTKEIVGMPASLYDRNSSKEIYPERTLLTLEGIGRALDQAIKHFPEQATSGYIKLLNELREAVGNDASLSKNLKKFIFDKIHNIENALLSSGLDSEKEIIAEAEELKIGLDAAEYKTHEKKGFYTRFQEQLAKGLADAIVIVGLASFMNAAGAIGYHLEIPQISPVMQDSFSQPNEINPVENTGELEHQQPDPVCPK